MAEQLEFTRLDPPERKRTYHFPGGKFVAEDVVAVCVRPGGGHRLETADGKRYVVAAGWLAIELDVDGWTF